MLSFSTTSPELALLLVTNHVDMSTVEHPASHMTNLVPFCVEGNIISGGRFANVNRPSVMD